MLAHEIVERYLDALLDVPDIWNKFPSSPAWGPEVIRSLVTSGLHAFPALALDAGYRDTSQRSESLALDVCIADPGSWGPPRFIAEHVSAPRRASIQHSAWKLLATRTERRVLVAYSGAKSDVRDHAALVASTRPQPRRRARPAPGRVVGMWGVVTRLRAEAGKAFCDFATY